MSSEHERPAVELNTTCKHRDDVSLFLLMANFRALMLFRVLCGKVLIVSMAKLWMFLQNRNNYNWNAARTHHSVAHTE